jgi:hypothetical protein
VEQLRDSAAMHRALAAVNTVGQHLARLAPEMARSAHAIMRSVAFAIDPDVALYHRRVEHGGMPAEARDWPDLWFSYQCSAFLCSSCPSDEHDLRCGCPHHRKDRP